MEPTVAHSTQIRPHRTFLVGLAVLIILLIIPVLFYLKSRNNREIVSGIVSSPDTTLDTTAGVTNVIFLGLGGEGHAAPDLTDSMIFLSLRHNDHSVSIISIPRDIWVDSMQAKINTAYHYGNKKREGGGRDLSKSAVAEVLGQPVHYVAVLNFEGFVKVIDAVGGIDVDVERAFDDYKYPITGKEEAEPEESRYEHLHFEKGLTHMSGSTALKFARSRYAEGEEGTDFGRSARQQKILKAMQQKIVSSQTLLNFDTISSIVENVRGAVDTDISDGEFAAFFKFFLLLSKDNKSAREVDISELFENPRNHSQYGGQWVLIPIDDISAIHDYVAKNLAE